MYVEAAGEKQCEGGKIENMRMLVYHINPNDRSLHILKNEEMFRSMGVDVRDGYNRELLLNDLSTYDVLYLNWFENIDGGAFYMPILRFVRRKVQLARIRRAGVKVLFCKHNKFPHNARFPILSRNLYAQLCKQASIIVTFNNEALTDLREICPQKDFSEKIRVVSPLNYIGAYPANQDSSIYQLSRKYEGKMIVGFVGRISAYKNVDLILRAAKELKDKKIAFLIFGEPVTAEYKALLEKSAVGCENVTLQFGVVPDEEMCPLLDVSNILIMPYSVKSASNSGTGRLAFSYAKTVISPDIASMNNIPEDLIYKYHYTDQNDHYEKMLEQICAAYNDWLKDPSILQMKGEKLKALMERDYSKEAIIKQYARIFSELGKK